MAKVAAIASMCVHAEVTHRPFMGEVVQALKLIYNDPDETCGDFCSQKDSSVTDLEFKGELATSESGWWNHPDGATGRLTYGHASSPWNTAQAYSKVRKTGQCLIQASMAVPCSCL
ncbi:hypothetical protein SAY87_028449 [Trapa incisa]|uniref:Uncharacterized protein n=1 Tax=Trapa incisa TaxID=236973 RepID=A0AAN7KUW9_9MYRT|nr:hypothetical protein SAY87_028449 [Trapa incisa]